MRYVAAAMLLQLAGKFDTYSQVWLNFFICTFPQGNDITEENIKKILNSVGVEVEKDKLDIVIKNLAGKNIDDLMVAGHEKLAGVPSGPGAAGSGSAPAASDAAPAEVEEKKQEKQEEPDEDSDEDMGFGLFD